MLEWAQDSELELIDLGDNADVLAPEVLKSGMRIGSVDLKQWREMLSPCAETRAAAVRVNQEYIEHCAALGIRNFFACMLAEDTSRPVSESFEYMLESYGELVPLFQKNDLRLVVEGWPGPGVVVCTPESYGAFLDKMPVEYGINYDPSHFVRMGIDPVRFLKEFADRVYHVHGKDTQILSENQYRYGTELPPVFAPQIEYGNIHWRYTIPGHGLTDWSAVLQTLVEHDYAGALCIELEDADFSATESLQKEGVLQGARFLADL